jgi:hypothetical protein
MVPGVSRIISNPNARRGAKVTLPPVGYELLTFLRPFDLIALCAEALKDSIGS